MIFRPSAVALGATLATALVLVPALVLGGAAAPADAAGATPTPAPTANQQGPVIKFKLPYLRQKVTDPNALDIARHAASPTAPLLVFLPGTGNVPAHYSAFLDTASSVGFSVLGLDYWDLGKSLTRTCLADAACYTQFQQNRFDGTDPSQFSRVDAANSILHRLRAALQYLGLHDPRGHWTQYLTTNSVRWSRIVLSGHSQGGGESAFIAHSHAVRGVLMFSAPVETFDDVSASWINTHGATPVSKMYGFDDVNDIYYDRIIDSWQRLGMGTVDRAAATDVPTGGHELLSSLYVGNPLESHGRSVSNGGPRRTDSTPIFRPVWEWMLKQVL